MKTSALKAAAVALLIPCFFVSRPENARTPGSAKSSALIDDFTLFAVSPACVPEGGSIGNWQITYTGYGCIRIAEGSDRRARLVAAPEASRRADETHATLLIGPSHGADPTLHFTFRTTKQLRQNAPPNAWEASWVLWGYSDPHHFYYFSARPGGWELGKEDPAYPGEQRFLATGTEPSFPLGEWIQVEIEQRGGRIQVSADGRLLADFTDVERPYLSGKAGLYGEDAEIEFSKVEISASDDH